MRCALRRCAACWETLFTTRHSVGCTVLVSRGFERDRTRICAPSAAASGSMSARENPKCKCRRHPSARLKLPDMRPTSAFKLAHGRDITVHPLTQIEPRFLALMLWPAFRSYGRRATLRQRKLGYDPAAAAGRSCRAVGRGRSSRRCRSPARGGSTGKLRMPRQNAAVTASRQVLVWSSM